MRELLRILSEPLLSSVEAIKWLFKSSIWKHIFRMLLPLIFIYCIIYMGIFIFTFIKWELPQYPLPIPFTGNFVLLIIDRALILVGVVFNFIFYIEDHH